MKLFLLSFCFGLSFAAPAFARDECRALESCRALCNTSHPNNYGAFQRCVRKCQKGNPCPDGPAIVDSLLELAAARTLSCGEVESLSIRCRQSNQPSDDSVQALERSLPGYFACVSRGTGLPYEEALSRYKHCK